MRNNGVNCVFFQNEGCNSMQTNSGANVPGFCDGLLMVVGVIDPEQFPQKLH